MLSDVMTLPSQAHSHTHDHHQLVVVLSGDTDFDISGKYKQLTIGAGCLVPSAESHVFSGKVDNRIMVVNLPSHRIATSTAEEYEHLARLFNRPSYFQLPRHLQQLALHLGRELESHPEDGFLARACGNMLLSTLHHQFLSPLSLSQLPNNGISQSSYARGRKLDMDQLDAFIERHLSRRLLVDELASFCFLSTSQFYHRFKLTTGQSPHQYLLQKRLTKAKKLVLAGFSLSDIAEQCGFSNQSAMSKMFSKILGMSPRHYQKQYK